jgi:hypothetical protein
MNFPEKRCQDETRKTTSRWCHAEPWNAEIQDIGPNYGFPCITGWNYNLDIPTTNCWFCGRDLVEEI